ncbi:MAG: hypothetical protein KJ645_02700 [Planctomycetes bacterium]|nr:hypothetical protein [Planctomycetota bacterium]
MALHPIDRLKLQTEYKIESHGFPESITAPEWIEEDGMKRLKIEVELLISMQ